MMACFSSICMLYFNVSGKYLPETSLHGEPNPMSIIQAPAIQAIDLRRVYNTRSSNHRVAAAAITRKKSITSFDGVSLTIQRGELFGLLVRHCAGTPTLIKLLTTVLAPTLGQA